MRRYSRSFALSMGTFLLAASSSLLPASENELFSTVTTESVYSTPNTLDLSTTNTSSADAKLATAAPNKNTLASRLSEALQQKGFETKVINDRIVSVKAKAENWTFPVIVTMSEDQKNLWLVVMLNVLKDEKQISQENLLGLLTANRQHAPAYFSYSPKQRRTELHRPLSTQGLTAESLKAEILNLTQIAYSSKELWSVSGPAAEKPKPAPTIPVVADAPSAPTKTPETEVKPKDEEKAPAAKPKSEAAPEPKESQESKEPTKPKEEKEEPTASSSPETADAPAGPNAADAETEAKAEAETETEAETSSND